MDTLTESELPELDKLQAHYKTLVDEWVTAIRHEEALASAPHSVEELDQWEAAAFAEEEIRHKVKAAKEAYEDGLRAKFYRF
jgi:hypothetical protein